MSDTHFDRVRDLFDHACQLSGEARQQFLDRVCADDAALRGEVEALLSHDSDHADEGGITGLRDAVLADQDTVLQSAAGRRPRTIGPYHIKSVIASGGMGTVYLAVQDQPRRNVALKVMRSAMASPSSARRFQYESQILARLRHPNIAEIYQAGTYEDDGEQLPYFAMEYIPGAKPITEFAFSNGLSTHERLSLFAKICAAVDHGHRKGIIHRDLKPGNILVDSNGDPKIIDFGVARAVDSDMAVTTQQTDFGQLIGTLQYMSPEQCDADPDDLDTRSDVYALGVVLYELLTGQLPYDLQKALIVDAMQIIRESAPVRPSTINTTLRGDVETITLKALEKDRRRRYRSAADLQDDILRYLNDEPIEARPQSLGYVFSKYVQRHRAGAVLTGVVALAVVVIGVLLMDARTARERAKAEAARAETAVAQARVEKLEAAEAARRDEVLTSIHFYAEELDDIIEEMPGAALARGYMAQRIVDDLERIGADSSDDPRLNQRLALAFLSLGEVYGGIRNPNLGDKQKAEAAFTKALELVRKEQGKGHSDVEVTCHLGLATWHGQHERYDDARTSLESALHVLKTSEETTGRRHDRTRAVVLRDLGKYASLAGEFGVARDYYEQARRLFAMQLDEQPDDPTARRDFAVINTSLGGMLYRQDAYEPALECFLTALPIRESLAKQFPVSNRYRRDLANTLQFVGYTYVAIENTEAAVPYLEDYVDIIIDLALESPRDQRARQDFADAHPTIHQLYVETKDRSTAIRRLETCARYLHRYAGEHSDELEQAAKMNATWLEEVMAAVADGD